MFVPAKAERKLKIQQRTRRFLENYFSKPHSEMLEHGLTPHQIAEVMSSDVEYVASWEKATPEMLQFLQECWKSTGFVIASHLRQMRTLKAVYGGNVFPHPKSNLVCNVGLYADTLVLPDPIFSCLSIGEKCTYCYEL